MQRREFIGLLGGAAASWPAAVQVQQAERVRRVGVLIARDEDDSDVQPRMAALVKALSLGLDRRPQPPARHASDKGHS
jgi:hypothetical protein